MKFSILVPVYNVEQYLEQCMESILAQTYQDFEVILVDDGSTDHSGEMCDQYIERYPEKIKVIHKKNQGLISARRVGIEASRGDFCVFVDSDDFVERNLLEVLENKIRKDEQIDILLFSFYYYRNGKKEDRKKIYFLEAATWESEQKKEIYKKLILTSDITSIWTKAIRTSILKSDSTDYTKYYGKNMAEDLLQSLYPMTVAKKIMFIDKALYAYRINDESISRSFRPETISKKNTLHVYKRIEEYLPIWKLDNNTIRQQLAARWFNEVMYFFKKYYEAAKSKKEREEVLEFDWKTLLPMESYEIENKYENLDYKKLFSLWEQKKFRKIHIYFFKKRYYRKIKRWKEMLIG